MASPPPDLGPVESERRHVAIWLFAASFIVRMVLAPLHSISPHYKWSQTVLSRARPHVPTDERSSLILHSGVSVVLAMVLSTGFCSSDIPQN